MENDTTTNTAGAEADASPLKRLVRRFWGWPVYVETTDSKILRTRMKVVGGVRVVKVGEIISGWHRANDDGSVEQYGTRRWWAESPNAEVSDRRAHGNENTTGANGGSLH